MSDLITTQKSISTIIKEFKDGKIAIPEIQRDVVWNADQVKSLLDSIYQGYPCGSLISWEPRTKDDSLIREITRPERLNYFNGTLPQYFLLDGQQRLSALASIMLKKYDLKFLLPELEEDLPYLYININGIPKEIEVGSDQSPKNYPWLLINEIFESDIYSKYGNIVIIKKEEVRGCFK